MNPGPYPVGHRVSSREPDDKQGAHERANAGDLHHHRRLGASVAEPCAGNTFLSRAIENRFGKAEPDLPVVGIDRAPAYLTSLFVHIPTLAHRTGWAVLFCREGYVRTTRGRALLGPQAR